MSHYTVAHRWFHQIGNKRTNENAYSNGNMFYQNKIIYSYGKHFALGIRFDDTVIINKKTYSSSTGKHLSHTWGAVDRDTHRILCLPLREAYHFDTKVSFKDVYKYVDFSDYVHDYKHNLKKLGNARKPELYTREIERLQNELNVIFKTFRGSKTLALKTDGIRDILRFEFSESMRDRLKAQRLKELENLAWERKVKAKAALKNLIEYENGEKTLNWYTLDHLGLDTVIRVNGDKIETSKRVHVDLVAGLRVFKLWKAGKALGVEINSLDGHTWKCTKVNGIIKFGCHVIDYDQAERVLKPYL